MKLTAEAAKHPFSDDAFVQSGLDAMSNYQRDDGRKVPELDYSRLLETLRLIRGIKPVPTRVCDLATYGGLCPVITDMFGISDITATNNPSAEDVSHLEFNRDGSDIARKYPFVRFDIEETFPLENAAFDLVIFTEVLEHLTRDPMLTLAEINRITRPDGWLLLSTPNSACLNSVLKTIRGEHPYNWSAYSRAGDRDRHNREYTPGEVNLLLQSAGYEIVYLTTMEVYDKNNSPLKKLGKRLLRSALSLARLLINPRAGRDWNGEIIFVLARKRNVVVERFPALLYY